MFARQDSSTKRDQFKWLSLCHNLGLDIKMLFTHAWQRGGIITYIHTSPNTNRQKPPPLPSTLLFPVADSTGLSTMHHTGLLIVSVELVQRYLDCARQYTATDKLLIGHTEHDPSLTLPQPQLTAAPRLHTSHYSKTCMGYWGFKISPGYISQA
jgi:hypothetical protein